MKEKYYFKILALLLTFFTSMTVVNADVEQTITVYTNVPTYATITKSNSSVEHNTLNATTGVHSGLSSVFNIETNGSDENYDLIMTSYIELDNDTVSAYGDDGRILFVHTTHPPTLQAVNNAKAGEVSNKNVIAYPTSISATNGITSEFKVDDPTYGNCYTIKLNNATSGNVTHNVLGTPSSNTYRVDEDMQGDYKAFLRFTLIGK